MSYSALTTQLIGQPAFAEAVIPRLKIHATGLCSPDRPAGVFMLLGPTGVGKTHSVEILAETLHKSRKNLLRIDCGEFQADHEVAKLIGAPPGYLGHRETQPWLTKHKLDLVTTPRCDLSIVLFDEIEKASESLKRILLGIMDKAVLRLGDATTVSFAQSFVFFTSNCGAADILTELYVKQDAKAASAKADAALRKAFSPEFLNRIDEIIMFNPLTKSDLERVLDLLIDELNQRVKASYPRWKFTIQLTAEAKAELLRRGIKPEYGVRELRRTVERFVLYPICDMLVAGTKPGDIVTISDNKGNLVVDMNEIESALRALVAEVGETGTIG